MGPARAPQGVEWFPASNGCPALKEAAAYMELKVVSRLETPDHWITYAEVKDGGEGSGALRSRRQPLGREGGRGGRGGANQGGALGGRVGSWRGLPVRLREGEKAEVGRALARP